MSPQSSSAFHLVGDVGGTNARFALADPRSGALQHIRVVSSDAFPTLLQAVQNYLADAVVPVRMCALGIANPIRGDWVEMTNHPWRFSAQALAEALDLDRLVLINDFTAMALGVPSVDSGQLTTVGAHREPVTGPIAVLGPGTGLGVSGLLPAHGDYVAIGGEGGHATLAARNPLEAAVISYLQNHFDHVSAERVVSGPGLVNLYLALCAVEGRPAEALQPADITQRAQTEPGSIYRRTTDLFCDFLGTVASDLALTLGAIGGVYIAGGVVPALGSVFFESGFRNRFESKGRFSEYLAAISTYIVRDPYCALHGAARSLGMGHLGGSLDIDRSPRPVG